MAEPKQPRQHAQHAQPKLHAQPRQHAKPKQHAQPAEHAEHAQPAQHAQPQAVGTQPWGVAPMQRDWSYGLCNCFGRFDLCCGSFWCPCIVYGKNKQRLRRLKTHGTPLPGGGEIFDGDCCLHCGLNLCGVAWVLQIGARGDIRDRYNIDGGACSDCCSSCWCGPCALTQERREIELEEGSFY